MRNAVWNQPQRPIPQSPLVKVCGLMSPADAGMVASAGADWIGLNFHPSSPRFLDLETAAAILGALPTATSAVGLFVDRPPAEVLAIADRLGLRIIQLHGHEPPEDVAAMKQAGLTVVRAFRLRDAGSIAELRSYLERSEALDAVLIDAFDPRHAGGTGRLIAEDLLAMVPQLPRLILAGGLTPANVAERVARVRPWMVDVASGVESAPGRKDPAGVAAFIRAARSGYQSGEAISPQMTQMNAD
jgi:phosphoribosylanthranilate isomerase